MRSWMLAPAAVLVVAILVGHGQSERRELPFSAQSTVTANGSPAAVITASQAAPAPSGQAIGGDTSGTAVATTATPVQTAEAVADSNPSQPSVTVTHALKAQLDERPVSTGEGAGSSPAQGSMLTPPLATQGASKAEGGSLYQDNEEQVRAALEALWPASEVERAMRVSWCESRYDPAAVEPSGDHIGTFQVDPSFWGPVPTDIWSQVAQALVVFQTQGWSAWSCA